LSDTANQFSGGALGSALPQLVAVSGAPAARYLERQGLLERDNGQPYLTVEALGRDNETPMHQLLGSSVTYRIAVGPQTGPATLKALRHGELHDRILR